MKDNWLCCSCKRSENGGGLQSQMNVKELQWSLGVKVKHCMYEFWCLAHLRRDSSLLLYTAVHSLPTTQEQLISPPPDLLFILILITLF